MDGGHIASLEMDFCDPPIVPAQKAPENLRQIASLVRSNPPHNAIVDRDDGGGWTDKQVSLMQIGMENPVIEGLGQKAAHQAIGQGWAV